MRFLGLSFFLILHTLLLVSDPSAAEENCLNEKIAVQKPNDTTSRYAFPRGSKNTVLVFVHGIFGDAFDTWYNKCTRQHFFDLMRNDPTFTDVDFFVYGFPSNFWGSNAWSIDTAVADLDQALGAGNIYSYNRIIVVAHSMGGLVAERFLLTFRQRAKKVPLLFMFSTPQEGALITKIARSVSNNPGIDTMIPGNKNFYLTNLDHEWKAAHDDGSISTKVLCAYEMLPTWGVRIVDESSATRLCAGVSAPIDADHIDIVKPADREARAYKAFKNAYDGIVIPLDQSQAAPILTDLNVDSLDGPYSLLPLDGYPILKNTSVNERIFTRGVKVVFSLSHNKKGSHSISLDGMELNVNRFEKPEGLKLAYEVRGDEIHGAGVSKPHVFKVSVVGSKVGRATWVLRKGGSIEARSSNFFDYDPPEYLIIRSDSDDTEKIIGTVMAQEAGLYHLSFKFYYTVGGEHRSISSEEFAIYRKPEK